jgi:hypothetical protein
MFLKSLDGRYAGEIREFDPAVGKELLRQGRAVNPYAAPVVAPKAAPKKGNAK